MNHLLLREGVEVPLARSPVLPFSPLFRSGHMFVGASAAPGREEPGSSNLDTFCSPVVSQHKTTWLNAHGHMGREKDAVSPGLVRKARQQQICNYTGGERMGAPVIRVSI